MYNPQLAGTSTANQDANKWLNIAKELDQATANFETAGDTPNNNPDSIEENNVSSESETTDFQAVADLENEQKAEINAGAAIEETMEELTEQNTAEPASAEAQNNAEPSITTEPTEVINGAEPSDTTNQSTATETNGASETSESKEALKNKETLGSAIGSLSKIIIIGEAQQSNHETTEIINRRREQKHTLSVLQEAYGRIESDKDQQNLPLEDVFTRVADHFLSLGKLNLELSEDPENQDVISEDSETGETLSTVYYQQAEACYWRASIAFDFTSGKFEEFRTSLDKQVAELPQQAPQQETEPTAEAVA